MRGSKLIPNPLRTESKVEVQLPPEVAAILRDLHGYRSSLDTAGLVIVGCAVALTLKFLFGKRGK